MAKIRNLVLIDVFLVTFLACGSPGVFAAELQGLYTATVEVADRSAPARARAVSHALEAVLVKVTGHGGVAAVPELLTPLQKAERYMETFRYNETLAPEAAAANESSSPELRLTVSFDAGAVDSLLHGAGLPVWGRVRPLILVWAAVEEGGERYFLEQGPNAELKDALQAAADHRGLPLVFPLMDLADQGNIALSDVWGNFTDSIFQASQRYRANAILVVRIHRTGGAWVGRWSLYQEGVGENWDSRGRTAAEVAAVGIDGAAERLAARFAHVRTAAHGAALFVSLSGVKDFSQYAQALRYLEQLDQVAAVQVSQVVEDHVLFRVAVRGDRDSLAQIIALGDLFVPMEKARPFDETQPLSSVVRAQLMADLLYRLVP